MPRRVYVGPIASIETILDGVQMTLQRGQAVDVSERQAAAMDRDTENWAKPKSPPSKKDGDS